MDSETKLCKKCGTEKRLEEFRYRMVDGKKFRSSPCIECTDTYNREMAVKNLEKMRTYRKNYASEYKERFEDKFGHSISLLTTTKRRGISVEEYRRLLTKQRGVCAICEGGPGAKRKNFAIDHDHATGAVRGLLCGKCNTAIGLLRDEKSLIKKALEYLGG